MMSIQGISLYNILRKRPGNEETAELVKFVKFEVKSKLDAKGEVFMTKDDKHYVFGDLSSRISDTKTELTDRINDTKIQLIERINETKIELIDRINKTKTETIRWIVGVGVLQFILSIFSKKFL
jgi:hypothetical protein